jgi:hypothetical protein
MALYNQIQDQIGYTSDKMGNPLNTKLSGPSVTPLSETVDTRGMYYGSPTTPDIWDYRSDIGTLGNVRHTTSAAQYKDKIAQALTPMKHLGAKPGFVENLIGGIGANVLGLGHEIKGLSRDWSQVKDPQWWKATGEDLIANLYGSIKGKTGVSDQEIYDSMLNDLIYDKGIMSNILDWSTIAGGKKKKGMDLRTFRNIYEKSRLKKKQNFQNMIKAAEAKKWREAQKLAKATAAQKATIAANKAAAKAAGDKPQKIYHQETRSQDRGGRDIGSRVSDSYEKQQSAQYGMLAKGGLVDFYKYGGFV